MPRTREVIPADALIEIARNPDRFEKILTEFADRQSNAVAAEGKAHEAKKEAGISVALMERTHNGHMKEVDEFNAWSTEERAKWVKATDNVSGREDAVEARVDAVFLRENNVKTREDAAKVTEVGLVDRDRRLEQKAQTLDDRETRLNARTDAILGRENEFERRLRYLIEGL